MKYGFLHRHTWKYQMGVQIVFYLNLSSFGNIPHQDIWTEMMPQQLCFHSIFIEKNSGQLSY